MRTLVALVLILAAATGIAEEPRFLADVIPCGSGYGLEPGDATRLVRFCNQLKGNVQEGVIPKVAVQGHLLQVYWDDGLARHMKQNPESAKYVLGIWLEEWRQITQRACVTLEFLDMREVLIARGETSFSGDQFYILAAS